LADAILQVEGLNKTFSGIRVLKDVNFALRKGEVHAVVGENGAGKTTMIKIIAGVERPDENSRLFVGGHPVTKMTAAKSIAMGISVIYQDVSLFPNLTIAENITKGLFKDFIVNARKSREVAAKALAEMGVAMDLNQKLGEVSVGGRQLVAIARAITFESKIIVMDEPTAALSSSEVEMLYNIIRVLKERGVSIIYISHKLDEVFAVADSISVLRDGELVKTGPASGFTQEKLINLMVGRELRFIPMRNELPRGEALFAVKGLTNEPYFRNLSFTAYKHEILGLTGLVGAGRSELAQTVFGMMKPQSGEVSIHGQRVEVRDPSDAINKGICYLPEDRRTQGLFQGHSMTNNITIVTLHEMLSAVRLIQKKKELATADDYIERISIRPNMPGITVENLSGGNQQKALISRWLNAKPKVLIVDEPTSGVDVGSKLEIHRLLRKLAASGVCVILVSSDLPEVLAISDRILVMRAGNIVHEAVTDDATQEGILEKGLVG